MSSRSVLLVGRETVEFPAHSLAARIEHLRGAGFDTRSATGMAVRRRGLARLRRPGLVHFTEGRSALEGVGLAARSGARIVVTLGGDDLLASGLADPGHYDPIWKTAAAVHLPDEALRAVARERGCPEDVPSTVIAPAAHPAFIAGRAGTERDQGDEGVRPLRLISVGPLDWTQGYEHAVHAVRLLADRGVECEYRIAGRGDYDVAVAFARFQLGLEDKVELLEPLTPERLREQLAWADAYLCPAVVAGTPAALLEAQAMGVPTVVSDAGRDPAVVDGRALVFRRRDPEALAEALARIAGDKDLRSRLAAGGREVARAHEFSEQLRAFEALYRDVLGES